MYILGKSIPGRGTAQKLQGSNMSEIPEELWGIQVTGGEWERRWGYMDEGGNCVEAV